MALIEGVETVFYQVCDMNRAIAFYQGVLGLSLTRREGNDWAELSVGGVDLALAGELATRPHQGGATVVLKTGDIEALGRHLAEHQVQHGQIDEMGGARMLELYDPDGNQLLAVQP